MFKFYLPLYDEENINNYKEFDKKLPLREYVPKKPGIPMTHQELIGNFMMGATPIDKLLLVHDLGTGKSCTAINAIEKNIRDGVYGMKNAIIINRGKAIMNNFINELVNKCTVNYNTGNEKIQKNLWSKYYTFDTFELFSKKLKKLSNENIVKKYNNTFLVVDEVHNIINDQSEVYSEIYRFIKIVPNLKVLLLSGTPVRDSPSDFIPIINLILPEEENINQKNFKESYYDSNGELTIDFKNKLLNRVSYLKSSIPEIKIIDQGNKILDLKKFNVVYHYMSDFQNRIYEEAYERDFSFGGVYNNSRQVSRFVFPDGSYGTEGFNNYIVKSNNNKLMEDLNPEHTTKHYRFKSIMIKELNKYGTSVEKVIERISDFSSKYAYIIKSLIEADKNNEKSLVYDDLVKGSGLIVFSLLLEFVGFKKYRLLTSETSTLNEISKIQRQFNEDVKGENISVLLGSKVIAEGFTFLDILHEHLVPHWNNTETMQVTARGIRMGSHNKTLEINPNAFVTVYRHVTLAENQETSIDYIMTKTSESKQMEIDKILNAIKEASITCNEFKERNGGKCMNNKTNTDFIQDNFISIGNLEKHKIDKIQTFFKFKTYSHFNQIKSELNFETDEELVKYLFWFIDNKTKIINNKGVVCFLNNKQNFYFLTEDIRTEHDVSTSFYTRDLKPYSVFKSYENATTIEISNLDSNKNIQRLLEMAATIRLLNLETRNISFVNEILSKYKDNWLIDTENNFAAVWYLSDIVEEKAEMRCLKNPTSDKPWNEWNKCSKPLKNLIFDKRFGNNEKFEAKLKKVNINYYGLWNPILNEFCIKNIFEGEIKKDKRNITSGKRCVNWKKEELLDIAKNHLKMDRNWNSWIEMGRKYICDDIKSFFDINKLLVENKSCGVQTKKKIL